ncbi:uncharacterized protein RCO7_09291 [Rhynchosporium graminicola]|uniref:Uncharacterized protein n=1 Tax=Rhynchosporium graminicola TaxID=2792576 RepID=A0A1E1LQY4_9HELO|nr:uncharacterized protein RCO7_09291 [Rhynchosporium commune]
MSLKGSPRNWWKDKRQSSHPVIPNASRPQTAFPWTEDRDRDLSQIVEKAVLAAFESTAFKIAVASQVDPAFSRHQEKLSQIKTANLNLESVLQAHVEDLPVVLKGIEDHVTGLKIPDYGTEFADLVKRNEELERRIDEIKIPDLTEQLNAIVSNQGKFPDHTEQLNTIIVNQTKYVKAIEGRFTALETRIEDLDRKTSDLSEEVTNADLRSAIRFGEISNELQDRNTTLNNSIWEVQRELGKKTDALQRRVVGACEEMSKVVRASSEVLESLKTKVEEDDVFSAVEKLGSKAEFSEKATRRTLASISEKVAVLDTSTLSAQTSKLETIERGIGEFRKEAEAARNLASVSSKFLSANTTKIDTMASAVTKMSLLVESTNELCQEVSESQESNAESVKEDVEAVRMHVRSLDNMAVAHKRRLSEVGEMVKRTEGAIGKVDERFGGVEDHLRVLPECKDKLDSVEGSIVGLAKDAKPQKKVLDDLTAAIEEMRGNVDTALSSHTESLGAIQQTVSSTASRDGLSTALSDLQSKIEDKLSSHHETTSRATTEAVSEMRGNIEKSLLTHVDSLDAIHKTLSSAASQDVLSAALSNLQSSIENKISSSHEATTSEMGNLSSNLEKRFLTQNHELSSQTSKLQTPMDEILTELKSTKTLLDTHHNSRMDESTTVLTAIESSRTSHQETSTAIKSLIQEIQESSKDDEILLQIESWAQNGIAKQDAGIAGLRDMLGLSQARDEDLRDSLTGLNEVMRGAEETLSSMQVSVHDSRNDTTKNEERTRNTTSEVQSKIDDLATNIKDFSNNIENQLQLNATALSNLDEFCTDNADALSKGILDIRKDVSPMIELVGGVAEIKALCRDLPKLEDIGKLNGAMMEMGNETRDVVLAKAEHLTSDIGKLASALAKIIERLQTAEKAHAEILTTVNATSTNVIGVQDVLKSVEDGHSTSFDGLKTDISAFSAEFRKENAELETGLKTELQALRQDVEDVMTAVSEASAQSIKTHTTALDRLAADTKVMRDGIITQCEETGTVILGSLEKAREAILEEVGGSKTVVEKAMLETTSNVKDVLQAVSKSESENLKMHQLISRAVAAESTIIQEKIVTAADQSRESLSAKMESNQERSTSDLSNATDELRKDVAAMQTTIAESREVLNSLQSVETNLTKQIDNVSANVNKASKGLSLDIKTGLSTLVEKHELISGTIKEDSKNLSELIVKGSMEMGGAIIAAKDATTSEIRGSNASLDEKLTSNEKNLSLGLSGLGREVTKGFADAVSMTESHRKTVLEALETSSLTIREATEESNADGVERLSKDIGARFEKVSTDHKATLEALQSERQSITAYIDRATELNKSATDALLHPIQENQQSLEALHKLACETTTSFNLVADDRKKTDGLVEMVIKAVEQQEKTITASVEKVQDAVVGSVRDMGLSLEKSITKEGEVNKESGETRSAILKGLMVDVIGAVKEEAQTTRKSTETIKTGIEESKSTLEKRIDTGFSNQSTENKASFKVLDTHISTLSSAIKNEAETTKARIETLETRILEEVQKTDTALQSSLSTLRTVLNQAQQTTSETHTSILSDIHTLSTSLSLLNTTITNLPPSLKAIDAAVRVNSAAIARVDKAVLESSSQVKSEIHTSLSSLSSQLDDDLQETARRVRGIAEYEIPRLEALAKRQRDALEVIGGRVIGTSKKFGEMVANVGKGSGGGGGGLNGGLDKSEILGLSMSGRLRGGSNASSTRSKDSGYRMGAFESGGRM